MSIPNMITLVRIILTPIFVSFYLEGEHTAAMVLLFAAMLSDLADGYIARKFNMISTLGQLLDPVADKATQFCLMICFAIEHPVLWSLLGLFVLKEGFQFAAMLIAYNKGKMLRGALLSGKICTTFLFISMIAMVLFHDQMSSEIVTVVTCIDGVFMLVAFIHYVITYCKSSSMIRNVE